MTRPNILWICTDQQRWDTLSCLGFKGAVTPNIDRLASRGVIFRNAYCQSPICTPSRASFLTGMYPIATQVHRNGNIGFPEHLTLVTKLFELAGYHNGLIGKLHLSRTEGMSEVRPDDGYHEFYPKGPVGGTGSDYCTWLEERGFDPKRLSEPRRGICDPSVDTEYSQTTWSWERALSFIENNVDKPWLLSLNVFDPHPPFDPPAEYMAKFDPAHMPEAKFRLSDIEHQKRFAGVDQQARQAVIPDEFSRLENVQPADARDEDDGFMGTHDTPPSRYNVQKIRAAYQAMILLLDDMVGSLLKKLEETEILENTIIVFTSDHGEMLGDHGLLYKGCRFYEGLVHVPLIISVPDSGLRGSASEALVELVDIAPTLLDLVGIDIPQNMQGKSLGPLLRGEAPLDFHKPYVLSEYFDCLRFPGSVGSRASMYFDGRHKLNIYHDAGEGELFDLESDPDEFSDRWHDPDYAETKSELLLRHFNAIMKVSGAGPERTHDF